MRILITSDTHGDLYAWNEMLKKAGNVDYIIHAGDVLYHGPRNPILEAYNPAQLTKRINEIDIPIFIAAGNCDAEVDRMVLNVPIQPSPLFLQLEGKRIIVHHGHEQSLDDLFKIAREYKANIVISGHTHIRMFEQRNNTYLVNPGSISLPKNEDKIPSFAIFEKNEICLFNLFTGEVIQKIVLN